MAVVHLSLTTKKPLICSLFCKWGNRGSKKVHALSKFPQGVSGKAWTECVPDSLLLLLPLDHNWPFTPPPSLCKHIILESDLSFPYLGPDLLSMGKGKK